MKETRSASQVLFGFLPSQTVDLRNGVWKVKDWRFPKTRNDIDLDAIRQEIIKQASPWQYAGLDGGFVSQIKNGAKISILTVDLDNGVDVEPFPRKWICKGCNRVHSEPDVYCKCGSVAKGQLFFVGYHDRCGTIKEPYIKKCPEHGEVKITFPGTASANEIIFSCPVCERVIRKGFGNTNCSCGEGQLTYQPHRASSVYTPRSIVVVNPPSKDSVKIITEIGGASKALGWVVDGMQEPTIQHVSTNKESLRRQLESQRLPSEVIDRMLEAAGDSIEQHESFDHIPGVQLKEAESQAKTIALATLESRVTLENLINGTSNTSELGKIYRTHYKELLSKAGISDIELIEKFPVLTGHYGYTRGKFEPAEGQLIPFKRGRHSNGFSLYSEIAETESLFIRLDPLKVAHWLTQRGHSLPDWTNAKSARKSILEVSDTTLDCYENESPGADLFELIHSFSHRFLRHCSVHSGIDSNALSELLVPMHLGFFIYAAARGEFVLGGLQAVFESELHKLLDSFVFDEHRCALDPGCLNSGGACMACLHIGEPSCRHFNRNLSRKMIYGKSGYLNSFS